MPIHNQFYGDASGQLADWYLADTGPILPVELHLPQVLAAALVAKGEAAPAPEVGWALIDTGATKTAVNAASVKTLGISPVGVATTLTAAGTIQQELYPVRFVCPGIGGVGWDIHFNSAAGVDLNGQTLHGRPLVALLGRDILSRCVMTYNGAAGTFTLAW